MRLHQEQESDQKEADCGQHVCFACAGCENNPSGAGHQTTPPWNEGTSMMYHRFRVG